MKQHINFGLSKQVRPKEQYDNWDLGIISKEGVKLRREQRKAETDSLNAQTNAMQKLLSEPTQTQNQEGGMNTGTAVTIGIIVVVGLIVGYGIINKKRKTKQATVQENTMVVDEII